MFIKFEEEHSRSILCSWEKTMKNAMELQAGNWFQLETNQIALRNKLIKLHDVDWIGCLAVLGCIYLNVLVASPEGMLTARCVCVIKSLFQIMLWNYSREMGFTLKTPQALNNKENSKYCLKCISCFNVGVYLLTLTDGIKRSSLVSLWIMMFMKMPSFTVIIHSFGLIINNCIFL